MKFKLINIVIGVILVLVGIITLIELRGLQFTDETGPGPAFFPALLAVLLIILAIFVLFGKPLFSFIQNEGNLKQTIGYFLLFVLTVLVIPYLGTSLAILIFTFIELVVIEKRKVLVSLLVSLGVAFSVLFIFGQVFQLPLPRGFLGI